MSCMRRKPSRGRPCSSTSERTMLESWGCRVSMRPWVAKWRMRCAPSGRRYRPLAIGREVQADRRPASRHERGERVGLARGKMAASPASRHARPRARARPAARATLGTSPALLAAVSWLEPDRRARSTRGIAGLEHRIGHDGQGRRSRAAEWLPTVRPARSAFRLPPERSGHRRRRRGHDFVVVDQAFGARRVRRRCRTREPKCGKRHVLERPGRHDDEPLAAPVASEPCRDRTEQAAGRATRGSTRGARRRPSRRCRDSAAARRGSRR